ncbi:hypothetical protein PTKIN_Ptkin06aG0184000 [Pterospermum kingtungense]
MAAGESYNLLEKILKERAIPSSSSECFISRAPPQLRQVNGTAFEPQIISIGPYHRGKHQTMEIHKVRYLRNLFERLVKRGATGDKILNSFDLDALNMEEERVRSCYEGTLDMSSAEFVTMMVLDGLFVVELLRKFCDRELREENDDIFKRNLNLTIIAHDLLLLENQLPFFLLNHFFEKTKLSPSEKSLDSMAIFFFDMMPGLRRRDSQLRRLDSQIRRLDSQSVQDTEDIKHLLGLVHKHCFLSPQESNFSRVPIIICEHFEQWEMDLIMGLSFIHSATELSEAGIRFKKRDEGNSLFDIKFERGQMHIPTLTVDHDTQRIFRNLIAYEQIHQGPSIVMDYARLMDCLINYADDVALLSDCGIIDNRLGTNEEVAKMFNKLNDYVYLSTDNFYYLELFHDVDEHCNLLLNRWKVKLRQTYFHTPWDWVLTSIVAASILLLLGFLQTLYSVLSYYK